MGQLLSAANTEHNWGDWQVAVWPDRNHNGLEIRTCADCGAQTSRVKLWDGEQLGDVNGDGFVNINDVSALIDILLGNDGSQVNSPYADVSEDGMVTIADISILINILLGIN